MTLLHATKHREPDPDVERAVREFVEWAGDDVLYRIAYRREHGKWFVLAVDFDITGRGDTLREAFDELLELVLCYLFEYYRDGQPFEAALRRIPLSLRAQILFGTLIGSVVHLVARRPRVAGKGNLAAPSSAVEHLLAC